MAKTKIKTASLPVSENGNGIHSPRSLSVLKTYKIYIDGKFPRTESGRFYQLKGKSGSLVANVSRSSRKDFREAVVAARKTQPAWGARAPFNRGQIIYRIAEMLEGRRAQFVEEMTLMGMSPSAAEKEMRAAIDRCVYYAGWCDKYQQVFSTVNPVSSSHFNFSVVEPQGVIGIISPEESALLGLISVVIPAIAGGNTVVVLASRNLPLCAVTFAEVLHSSDVPGGVVNLLTGFRDELMGQFVTHMDVNGTIICGASQAEKEKCDTQGTSNLKRIRFTDVKDWHFADAQGPYFILDSQEVKTTWHPIGI